MKGFRVGCVLLLLSAPACSGSEKSDNKEACRLAQEAAPTVSRLPQIISSDPRAANAAVSTISGDLIQGLDRAESGTNISGDINGANTLATVLGNVLGESPPNVSQAQTSADELAIAMTQLGKDCGDVLTG